MLHLVVVFARVLILGEASLSRDLTYNQISRSTCTMLYSLETPAVEQVQDSWSMQDRDCGLACIDLTMIGECRLAHVTIAHTSANHHLHVFSICRYTTSLLLMGFFWKPRDQWQRGTLHIMDVRRWLAGLFIPLIQIYLHFLSPPSLSALVIKFVMEASKRISRFLSNRAQMIELTKSDPAVAPAPKMAALPSFSPSFLAHAPCCTYAISGCPSSYVFEPLLTLGCCGLAG